MADLIVPSAEDQSKTPKKLKPESISASEKVIAAWCQYDWANSAFSLVITSTYFPVYYGLTTRNDSAGNDVQDFFGYQVSAAAMFSWAVSLAVFITACLSPFLSALSDLRGWKKHFLRVYCVLGAMACVGLFFFTKGQHEWGLICFTLGLMGYAGSMVFYNAYLPEITTPDRYDAVSAKGFAQGYIGSVLLQVVLLVPVLQPELVGLPDAGLGMRLSFVAVGLWWLGFSLKPFSVLPNAKPKLAQTLKDLKTSIFTQGIGELKEVYAKLKQSPITLHYLGAFFLYNLGVQTVMVLAALFGEVELHLPSAGLIATILLLQLVAIVGAKLFSKASKSVGNFPVITTVIVMWIGVCIAAFFTYTDVAFYSLAAVVGLVMGGIQSISRSTYAKLLPSESHQDNTSFFSFYDLADKFSTVGGTFLFGLVTALTGSMRNSVWVLAFFFLLAFLYMIWIIKAGKQRGISTHITGK